MAPPLRSSGASRSAPRGRRLRRLRRFPHRQSPCRNPRPRRAAPSTAKPGSSSHPGSACCNHSRRHLPPATRLRTPTSSLSMTTTRPSASDAALTVQPDIPSAPVHFVGRGERGQEIASRELVDPRRVTRDRTDVEPVVKIASARAETSLVGRARPGRFRRLYPMWEFRVPHRATAVTQGRLDLDCVQYRKQVCVEMGHDTRVPAGMP